MQAQDKAAPSGVERGVTVIVPDEPPVLNPKAARTLLKILLAVAESDRELATTRERAA